MHILCLRCQLRCGSGEAYVPRGHRKHVKRVHGRQPGHVPSAWRSAPGRMSAFHGLFPRETRLFRGRELSLIRPPPSLPGCSGGSRKSAAAARRAAVALVCSQVQAAPGWARREKARPCEPRWLVQGVTAYAWRPRNTQSRVGVPTCARSCHVHFSPIDRRATRWAVCRSTDGRTRRSIHGQLAVTETVVG